MPAGERGRSWRFLPHALLVSVVMLWGATFPLVKSALSDASPLLFNLLRMSLAAAALAVLNHRRLRSLGPRRTLMGAAAGLLLGAGYQLQTAGLALTSATRSAFLTGLMVLFVPLIEAANVLPGIPRQRLGGAKLTGALLAFAGVTLLTFVSGGPAPKLFSAANLGDLLSLLCALAFALHLLALSRIAPGADAGALATVQVGSAAVLMLLTLPLGGPATLHLNIRLAATLLVTALLATAAAFTVQTWVQQLLPATHAALILTLEPVFALLTSILFFGEHLSGHALLGAGLILSGILLAEWLSPAQGMTHGPAA